MGGLPSQYSNIYRKDPELNENECEFRALSISEAEVGRYLKLYDNSKSDGKFDICKFLDILKIEQCGFAKYAVTYYASKRNLDVEFRPFVYSVWNFCTLREVALVDYLFDLYDDDDSGDIDPEEAQTLLTDIYGGEFSKCFEILRAYNRLAMMVSCKVNPSVFQQFVKDNPSILDFPLAMQKKLRAGLFGERHWVKQTKFRVSTLGKKYRPIRLTIKASHKKARETGGFMKVKATVAPASPILTESPSRKNGGVRITGESKGEVESAGRSPVTGKVREGSGREVVTDEREEHTPASMSRGLKRALSSSAIGAPKVNMGMTLDDVMSSTTGIRRAASGDSTAMQLSQTQTHMSDIKRDERPPSTRRNSGAFASTRGHASAAEKALSASEKSAEKSAHATAGRRGSACAASELTLDNIAAIRAQTDKLTPSQQVNIKVEYALNKQDAQGSITSSRRHSLPTLPAGMGV